jgi:hypothetical protein
MTVAASCRNSPVVNRRIFYLYLARRRHRALQNHSAVDITNQPYTAR